MTVRERLYGGVYEKSEAERVPYLHCEKELGSVCLKGDSGQQSVASPGCLHRVSAASSSPVHRQKPFTSDSPLVILLSIYRYFGSIRKDSTLRQTRQPKPLTDSSITPARHARVANALISPTLSHLSTGRLSRGSVVQRPQTNHATATSLSTVNTTSTLRYVSISCCL